MASTDSNQTAENSPPTIAEPATGALLKRAASHRGVVKEIHQLIAPYKNTTEEPPFTAEELVVMACMCLGPYEVNHEEIVQWILRQFGCFQDRAMTFVAKAQAGANRYEFTQVNWKEDIVEGFCEVFERWTVPLVDDDGDSIHWDENSEMVVPLGPGRLFLSKWLDPPRKGSLPFFKLPAELRNTVYEMVFSMPSEIIVESLSRARMHVHRRWEETAPAVEFEEAQHFQDSTYLLNAEDRNLDLLRVNKQMYQEAMPFFYRLNTFHCLFSSCTMPFLNRLSPDRRKHLTKLKLDLAISGDEHELRGFRMTMRDLAEMPALEVLEIWIHDRDWLDMTAGNRRVLSRKSKFKRYDHIPGFAALAQACSKARSFAVKGNKSGAFKEWVEREMGRLEEEQAKGEPEGKQVGGKRGAGKQGGAGDEGPRKKIKKARGSH